MKPTLTNGTEH